MLANIKSKYIMKIIFSILNENKKLKLVKYNKSLKEAIEINLNKYKMFSGRYIIYEENQKIKEFNIINDNLIYEGECLSGERNGKGKEYNKNGKLIFEGEYLKGKRNGKGKEYDGYGKLLFEGEFLNGKKNGKLIKYYEDGKLIIEEEYLNGKRLK